jgi:hypothetical protein
VTTLDAVTARALGIGGHGALLARPDGVPAALWSGRWDATDVERAVERAVAPPELDRTSA